MKGIVFTEFLEMVEEVFSVDVAEEIIERADLPSGGAYTAVGTYEHNEMVQLATQLSAVTKTPLPELLGAFGKHLFARFVTAYPQFIEGVDSTFDFLAHVEDYIHVEVLKLYPDAELPRFEVGSPQTGSLELTYYSHRPFADLAEGLIVGCAEYFGDEISIQRTDRSDQRDGGVCFLLTSKATASA